MTKIAIIRGDFASPWELQNFVKLPPHNDLTAFTGLFPITPIEETGRLKVEKLFSPVDLNFGHINRFTMALLNRSFVDAHVLFGLEKKLMGFDIAHVAETYYSYTHQSLVAKKRGIVKRVVSTVWENIPFNNEGIIGRKTYKRYAFDNTDLFLPVTKKAKDALVMEGCPTSKIEILKPGITLSNFRNERINRVNKKELRILFVGRLEKDKGIDLLLGIFEKLASRNPILKLVVVGTGSKEQLVIDAQNRTPGINYLGGVPYKKMPEIYSSCDIFVHPAIGTDTWQEQYGMVLIEAMASGLPILSFDKGSIAEVVGTGGIVTSPEKFEKELSVLLTNGDTRRNLSKRAIEMAKQNYDANHYAQKLNDLYREILK